MRDSGPDESSIQTVALRAKDRVGTVTESRAKIYWQKQDDDLARVLLQFSDPSDLRGSALLLIEKQDRTDMFMYLPELGKVKRVTGRMMSGSMFGTDFSYEDFERLQAMRDDTVSKRLEDEKVEGKAVYVIEARPEPAAELVGSVYDRVVSYIDQERCIPLVMEFYEKGKRLRKRLVTDTSRITEEGDTFVPRRMVMTDLRDNTETELLVEQIEVNKPIKRSMFTTRSLERRRR